MAKRIVLKDWYLSKTVWLNVISTIVLVASMMGEFYPGFVLWAILAGVGNIILRVWFTSEPITHRAVK